MSGYPAAADPKTVAVDYGRDCGEFEGAATQRLESRGDEANIVVRAASYWNASGLILEKGVTYRIAVDKEASVSPVEEFDKTTNTRTVSKWWTWCDATRGMPPGATVAWCNRTASEPVKLREMTELMTLSPGVGWWPRVGEYPDWLRLLFNMTRWMAREPGEKLFYLMGAIHGKCDDGRHCGRQFPIGLETTFSAPADGEFCAFANDYPTHYGNNAGAITLVVTRQ